MHILMCDAHHKMRLVLSDSEVVQAIEQYVFLHGYYKNPASCFLSQKKQASLCDACFAFITYRVELLAGITHTRRNPGDGDHQRLLDARIRFFAFFFGQT